MLAEAGKLGEAIRRGDWGSAAYHAGGVVPLVGPGFQQVEEDARRGDDAAAVGHAAATMLPFLLDPALKTGGNVVRTAGEGITRAAEVAKSGIETAVTRSGEVAKDLPGVAAKGAVSGALYGNPLLGIKLALGRKLFGTVRSSLQDVVDKIAEEAGQRMAAEGAARQAAAEASQRAAAAAAKAPKPTTAAEATAARGAAVELTPEEQALADHIIKGTEPQEDLEAPPAAAQTTSAPAAADESSAAQPEQQAPTRTVDAIQQDISQHYATLQGLIKQQARGTTPGIEASITGEMDTLRKLHQEPNLPPGTTPAAAAPEITPGQAYAESQGYNWQKLPAQHQALMEDIARARANVAAQPEPIPRTLATSPPAEPVQQPPAAPSIPQEIAQNLKTEMERSGTAPPPEAAPPAAAQPTFAEAARAKKTDALFDFITQKKIPMSWVGEFGDKEWKMVADAAGVNPPSETTIGQLKQRLADYEKAQNIPVNPTMTPAEAQAAFEQARATRIQQPPSR
jgi:hypothetical protein